MAGKNDVILTSYCRVLLAFLLAVPLSLAILGYLIISPGIDYKNPFLIFTGLYASGEYLLLLGLIGFTLIPVYLIYSVFTAPFKLIFSNKGIRVYSLWFFRSLFLRWEELTEFQVVEVKTEGVYRRYYAETVIVSKKFSTISRKSRSYVGPLFPISDDSDAIERILELYQKSQRNQTGKVV